MVVVVDDPCIRQRDSTGKFLHFDTNVPDSFRYATCHRFGSSAKFRGPVKEEFSNLKPRAS